MAELPVQVVNCIYDHSRSDCEKKNVLCDTDIFMTGRRGAELCDESGREVVINDPGRQGSADRPFLGLSRRHAPIVFFGKAWRATLAFSVMAAVIIIDYNNLVIGKVFMRFTFVFPLVFVFMFILVFMFVLSLSLSVAIIIVPVVTPFIRRTTF